MQFLVTPYSQSIEPYAWWRGAFTDDELKYLNKIASAAEDRASAGNHDSESVLKVRRSKISWLEWWER